MLWATGKTLIFIKHPHSGGEGGVIFNIAFIAENQSMNKYPNWLVWHRQSPRIGSLLLLALFARFACLDESCAVIRQSYWRKTSITALGAVLWLALEAKFDGHFTPN